MSQRLIAVIFVLSICVRAQAITANFNTLTAGTSYAAPATFSSGGLDFDVLFGLGNANVVAVSGQVNPAFTGNFLKLSSNTGLNANLPTGASQIQFDFVQNSPATAFVVNGGWLDSSQVPGTVNGVTLSHSLPTQSNWGSVTASGNINTFFIVGTEFLVDNFSVTPLPGLPGDYNKNNTVDAADFVLLRKTINSPSGYKSWRANFGSTGSTGTEISGAGVPEPSGFALLLFAMPWLAVRRWQRSACCAA